MREYERLIAVDPIQRVEQLVEGGHYVLDEQSHIIPQQKTFFVDHAWAHAVVDDSRQCAKWFGVYWKTYGLLSQGCMGCWKVSARPNNLEQLFNVFELQKKMGLPAKCGMERREIVRGIYNAFWYAPLDKGLDGGRALYKKVKRKIKQSGMTDVKVILKRA